MYFLKLKSLVKDHIKQNGKVFRVLDNIYRIINSIPRLKWGLGSTPDFIIIGGQKCGTTSLYHYLIQHPQVKGATTKEISYFSGHYHKGINWYKSHFPMFKGKCLTGEASTSYMYYDYPAKRIMSDMPNVKLIVLLRDRIDRSYSDFQHQVRAGREHDTFENMITRPSKALHHKTFAEELKTRNKLDYENDAYIPMSMYYDRLKHWFKVFGKDNILIVRSEQLFSNPEQETNRIFKYLGIQEHKLTEYKNMFKGGYTSKVPSITRKQLHKLFESDIQKFEELTGEKI